MSEPRVVMYSTGWCGFCARARALLDRKGIAYQDIDVDDPAKREEMMTRSGRRSVPQIFIGERHIGGWEELSTLERAGELEKLVNEVRT